MAEDQSEKLNHRRQSRYSGICAKGQDGGKQTDKPVVEQSTLMNRMMWGRQAMSHPDRHPFIPPHSGSTVILQGHWVVLKGKYWQDAQSSMSGTDLQFDCHIYLMLGEEGRTRHSEPKIQAELLFDLDFIAFLCESNLLSLCRNIICNPDKHSEQIYEICLSDY